MTMTEKQGEQLVASLASIATSLQALVTFAQAASAHFKIQQPVVQPPKRQTFRP
jgi:hypothetical protein